MGPISNPFRAVSVIADIKVVLHKICKNSGSSHFRTISPLLDIKSFSFSGHTHHISISKYAVANQQYLPPDLQIAVATFCAIPLHLWSFKCIHGVYVCIYLHFPTVIIYTHTRLTCVCVRQVFTCGHLDCSTCGCAYCTYSQVSLSNSLSAWSGSKHFAPDKPYVSFFSLLLSP